MSSRLYTKQLAGFSQNSELATLYAPISDGLQWVIRTMYAFNYTNEGSGDAQALIGFRVTTIGGDGHVNYVWKVAPPYATTQQGYLWNGTQAMLPGVGFTVESFDANWTVLVTGWELTLP